ncbi:hypothetical protein [Hymenobacter sp. DG25A]|uniref:hypothetical protein n=1 Tax=Hymenobacter sp. DG25A TaxID=1385663 RepID=UPI0006C88B89|nr:hypothetical protein [Hymenobacter sp. DG25A]
MKQHFHYLRQSLAALVVVAAGLSSCSRAEYAMLPKTTPYHGTERVVAAQPAPVAVAAEEAAVAAPALEAAPVAVAPKAAPATTAQAAQAASHAMAAASPKKMSMLQKVAVGKVAKQMNKLAQKAQVKTHSDTAKADALSGNIRKGIILLLIGLLISLFSGISAIFGILGGIIAIIGIIFIILGLLDEV